MLGPKNKYYFYANSNNNLMVLWNIRFAVQTRITRRARNTHLTKMNKYNVEVLTC